MFTIMQGLYLLGLIYLIGFLYYEKRFLIFYYNSNNGLYYCKRETLYNVIENRKSGIKINYTACFNSSCTKIKKLRGVYC